MDQGHASVPPNQKTRQLGEVVCDEPMPVRYMYIRDYIRETLLYIIIHTLILALEITRMVNLLNAHVCNVDI